MNLAVLATLCVAVYVVLFLLGNAYSIRTGWKTPRGTEDTDWVLRRNVAFALGLIASVLCAVGSWLWVTGVTSQLVAAGEGALLAATGASDLRRFHLPLPFTMGGIAIAIAAAFAMRTPLFVMLFGLGWALALILLHAVLSKGSMQLGDHIATIWIALVAPFNGMLALLAGDMANVILARVKGLKGKKVAAAGTWLIVCAALVGVPSYVTWSRSVGGSVSGIMAVEPEQEPCTFEEGVIEHECSLATVVDRVDGISTGGALAAFARWQTPSTDALITLTVWAGDTTARVILAEPGPARKAAAQQAALIVERYAALAHQMTLSQDSEVAEALDDLALALDQYDVDGVGKASARLRNERERLMALIIPASTVEPASRFSTGP